MSQGRGRGGAGREVEGTLLLRTEDPGPLRRRLAELRRAGSFDLRPRAAQRIRDIYLDTPGRDLGDRRIALRLRRLDGTALLALKADSVVTEVAADRVEIEDRWSDGIVARVLAELARRGVPVPRARPTGPTPDPLDALRSWGFITLQDRDTGRLPLDVVSGAPEPVAEMAVDEVVYRLEGGDLRLHEVEVEARGAGDAGTVGEVTGALRAMFPELHPWPHGKLATGIGLQALLRDGRLEGLVQADGTLAVRGYEVLSAWCQAEAR